jgi:penicillin-binding protein 2
LGGYKLTFRLIAMTVLVVALAFIMGLRLASLQFSEGAAPEPESLRTVSRSVSVPATRGEIFDRYGRALVTNKLAYNVSVDRAALFRGGLQAEVISRLIRAADVSGVAYEQTLLPVTLPPFAYTEMTPDQKEYLDHYRLKKDWPDGLSATELMDRLFDEYGMTGETKGASGLLNGLSVYQARLVAGVLYEIDLRYQAGLVVRDEASGEVTKPYLRVPAYTFASDVPMELIAIISENRFAGINVVPVTAREIHTDAAGPILGRIGPIQDAEAYEGYRLDELVGIEGVEKAFEPWLRGIAGVRAETVTPEGRVVEAVQTAAPEAGKNVFLTIDIRFQEELEWLLAKGVQNLVETGEPLRGQEAEAAAAAVINPNTGEVLAAANYPTYSARTFMEDFAALRDDPLKPLYNRAINGTYAPGSTFKMVTAAAAMENGTVTPSSTVFDRVKYTFYPFPQPSCTGSHGHVNVCDALKVSCNYYFFETGRITGISEITNWANRFGLGVPTGVELEDTSRDTLGWVANPQTAEALNTEWWDGNTLSAAIGQENNQFTPVQLANYAATIANGGTRYKAHLLKEVLSYDYTYEYHVSKPEAALTLGMQPQNIAALQEGMSAVTQYGGTAYGVFRDFEIPVAGKTGSAQVGGRPNNGVFVAYAPADKPQIAVAVVVEKGGAGSTIAPIARDIIDLYFRLQADMRNNPAEGGLLK